MEIKKILFIVLITLVFTSCGSKKKVIETKPKEKEVVIVKESSEDDIKKSSKEKSVVFLDKLEKENTRLNKKTLEYLKKFYPIALSEMNAHKIPASITLAQGILESGNGFSDLATRSNNHFGIKCHRGWTGEKVYHDDDEKGECFRKYQHPDTSYKDHSQFLVGRKRYASLFNLEITDYKRWAKGLQKAGYATDRKYPEKLISLIERYQLYNFDTMQLDDSILKNNDISKTPNVIDKYYKVLKGDTLYSIAKKLNTTVQKIKKINGLTDTNINIGQRLLVK